MPASDPSPVPECYPEGSIAHRIWRGLECKARGTLLVHGSKALSYGPYDAKGVITRMVEDGVLIPCKVDLACSDHSAKAFAGLQVDGRHIERSPWCTDYALFWTYEPGNRTPMREWHP